jgi:hypothetical protein
LLTYRHDAGIDLDAWNLAMLGKWQRESLQSSKDRIRWVEVGFKTVEEREKFEGAFKKLKTLLIRQRGAYYEDLRSLRLNSFREV